MINYVLATFFAVLGVVTLVTDNATPNLIVGLVWFTVAALLVVANWQEKALSEMSKELEQSKTRHPNNSSNWPNTNVELYDWSKEQENEL